MQLRNKIKLRKSGLIFLIFLIVFEASSLQAFYSFKYYLLDQGEIEGTKKEIRKQMSYIRWVIRHSLGEDTGVKDYWDQVFYEFKLQKDTFRPVLSESTPVYGAVMSDKFSTISFSFDRNVIGADKLNNYQLKGSAAEGVKILSVTGEGAGPYVVQLDKEVNVGYFNLYNRHIFDSEVGKYRLKKASLVRVRVVKPLMVTAISPELDQIVSKDQAVEITFNHKVSERDAESDGSVYNVDHYFLSGPAVEGVSLSSVEMVKKSGRKKFKLNFDSDLKDGAFNIAISGIEGRNNVVMDNFDSSFIVDNSGPDIAITSPSYIISNDEELVVSGLFQDSGIGVKADSLVVKINGIIEPHQYDINTGEFFVTSIISLEGAYDIEIHGEDLFNHASTVTYSFAIDYTNPTLNITNPDTDGLIFTTTSPTFIAEYNDIYLDLSSLQMSLNGEPISDLGEDENGFSCIVPDLENGDYTLSVTVSDLAGNQSTVTRTLSIDVPVAVIPIASGELTEEAKEDGWNSVTIASGINPQHLRVVDANKDGKMDIVYKEINDGQIKVIYQD